MAFFNNEHKKLSNLPTDVLKQKYVETELKLQTIAKTGNEKALKEAMKEHGNVEYALLYQKTPEFKEKYKPVNEFRYNIKTKHMNYVFGSNGKKNKAIGLTSEPTTFGRKNMPLKKNTQKNNTAKSYARNGIVSDRKDMFSHISPNHCFDDEDFKNVKSKIRNYKKRTKNLW